MEYTEQQLVEKGIIRSNGKTYQNAVVECYSNGGVRGIWIDGTYYKAIHHIHSITFDRENLHANIIWAAETGE